MTTSPAQCSSSLQSSGADSQWCCWTVVVLSSGCTAAAHSGCAATQRWPQGCAPEGLTWAAHHSKLCVAAYCSAYCHTSVSRVAHAPLVSPLLPRPCPPPPHSFQTHQAARPASPQALSGHAGWGQGGRRRGGPATGHPLSGTTCGKKQEQCRVEFSSRVGSGGRVGDGWSAQACAAAATHSARPGVGPGLQVLDSRAAHAPV